ncbi:MAG TPA: spore coat protein [Clostridia bacterium]|nr:spore coat protein [Clostridia bacterium]
MSSKELLYLEDALGHEKFLITQCQHAAQNLQDPELRQFAQQSASKHQQIFNRLYQLI